MRLILTMILMSVTMFLMGQTEWTNATGPGAGTGVMVDMPEVIPTSGVDFYMDAAAFGGACPTAVDYTTEDFSGTNVPANSIESCTPVINSTTSDACFPAGGIVEGLELATDGDDLVILTEGFFGAPFNAVGPNTFADQVMTINLSVPANVFSIEVLGGFVSPMEDVEVEVFGASGSLGTTTITLTGLDAPVYVGIAASEEITSITLTDITPNATTLVGNIEFGNCEVEDVEIVPTMGEWGLMSLGLILMIFGVVAVRNRKIAVA